MTLWMQGRGDMAAHALYAALFEPGLGGLELWELPPSHMIGPDYLNVLRFLDVPQALAMAGEKRPVRLHQTPDAACSFARETARKLGWNQN